MTNDSSLIEIDEVNLDKECIQLPSNYLKAAHLAADAGRDVEELKRQLDVLEADIGKEIRAHPSKYGLEKVTEAAINETILTLPAYRTAQQKLAKAKHDSQLASALVQAMEYKKRSLQMLVELKGMGWYSEPRFSKQGKEAVDDMTKQKVRRNLHRG